jgi:hypothetical protein
MTRASPETAAQIAEGAVTFVQRKFGIELPYNPPSLILVDAILDKIRATGASEHQASGLLLGLGCYVGEVLVRNARASWRLTAQMKMAKECRFAIVAVLTGGVACDPIGKVFERFTGEATPDLAEFYQTTLEPARRCPTPPGASQEGKLD